MELAKLHLHKLKNLEAVLLQKKDPLNQLKTHEELSYYYCYTNIHKAQAQLAKMSEILREHPLPDFLANYYLYSGFVENQLYNHQRSEYFYQKAMELLVENGDLHQQADALISLSGTYFNLEKIDLAIACLDKAKRLLNSFPDDILQARWFCQEGNISLHHQDFNAAMESFLEAEKILSPKTMDLSFKDYYYLTLIHSGLGNVYEKNEDREKSSKAYLKGIQICEAMGMKTRISWHYLNVGRAFLGMDDYDKAEFYFQKAISNPDDLSPQSRASAYGNLGFISLQKKEYDKALELFDRAETIYNDKSTDALENFAKINLWKGQLFSGQNKDKKAIRCYEDAYEQARQVEANQLLCSICKDISAFHAERRDFQKAYIHLLLMEEYTQKHLEEIKQRKITELEVRYEAQKKKQEAELLQLQATKLQMKALRAQMNPHFMHNAMNSIQDYIMSGDMANASWYLSKFAELMRQSLDHSEQEITSLEKEIEFLENYLELNKKLRFEGTMDYSITVAEEIEEDIFGVPSMIVQPYVENAIEHGIRSSKSGFIHLDFQMFDENTILCIVEDNGVGREEAMRKRESDPKYRDHKSMGTQITEQRLQLLNATTQKEFFVKIIDLVDEITGNAKGTRVEISIPILEIPVAEN